MAGVALQQVQDAVEVKLFADAGELYVLAKSEGQRAKERAMRRKRLARLLRRLRTMQRPGWEVAGANPLAAVTATEVAIGRRE